MSIRGKLQVALWAMVIVPNVIMISLIVLLLYFLSDQTLHELMNNEKNMQYRQATALGELSYVLRNEPVRIDAQYVEQMRLRLEPLSAGFVVEQEGKPPIVVAPMLKNGAESDEWRKLFTENDNTNIGGYRYQIHHLSMIYPDGSHGSAVLFRQEETLPIYWKVLVPLIVLLALVATSIFLTYLVSRSIIRPLYSLKQAAEQISEGRLDGEVRSTTKDEIGELAEAFDTMRIRLKASIEERLQDEDNRKMLLSHISHDLKTPITAIKGYVEGILDGVANTEEKQEKYLRTVYRKATDMDRLIDELFLFSRLDMHHVAYDFKPIDLRRYLAHYTEELQFELEKESISLETSGIEGPPLIIAADPEKLGRVFHNIVGNSIKYMDRDEQDAASRRLVAIHVSENEAEATVEIRDNGPGVPPESLPLLFDHFYRTEQSRNVETGGSGLGLAIVKQIMEGHGGEVRAKLPAEGGLVIIVTLRRWSELDKHETAGGDKSNEDHFDY